MYASMSTRPLSLKNGLIGASFHREIRSFLDKVVNLDSDRQDTGPMPNDLRMGDLFAKHDFEPTKSSILSNSNSRCEAWRRFVVHSHGSSAMFSKGAWSCRKVLNLKRSLHQLHYNQEFPQLTPELLNVTEVH